MVGKFEVFITGTATHLPGSVAIQIGGAHKTFSLANRHAGSWAHTLKIFLFDQSNVIKIKGKSEGTQIISISIVPFSGTDDEWIFP